MRGYSRRFVRGGQSGHYNGMLRICAFAATIIIGYALNASTSWAQQARYVRVGCVPKSSLFKSWSIENNPVVPISYTIRGTTPKCSHQLWEDLANSVTSVKIIRQPKFGQAAYNPGFRSIDYFRRDKNTTPDNLAAQVCGTMDGKRGCITLEYSYVFE
jgi:hypothetical protein